MKKYIHYIPFVVAMCLLASVAIAQTPIIRTIAGRGSNLNIGDGGPAIRAGMGFPMGVAVDRRGNVFIADNYYNVIRKVTPDGIISTIAGTGYLGYTGDGGPASVAKINAPYGIRFDRWGNLYIADGGNFAIRKIDTNGIISTVAGGNGFGSTGDGGPATNAKMGACGVDIDDAGNIYIADCSGKLRKVNTSGIISTVAGRTSLGYSGNGGPATAALFNGITGVAVNGRTGEIFVADQNNNIVRKISTSGIVTLVGGTPGSFGSAGDGGNATSARMNGPNGLRFDTAGNLFVADLYNSRIRKINTSGIISTVVGINAGFLGDGGPATAAKISFGSDVNFDHLGNMYIADQASSFGVANGHRIRQVFQVSTLNVTTNRDTNLCVGDTITFSAAYTSPPYGAFYRWQVNGVSAGTNSPTFTTNTLNNGDRITCSLYDTLARFTIANSNTISVVVRAPVVPTLSVSTSGDTVCRGNPVTFRATSTNGGATPSYTWRVYGSIRGTGDSFTYIPDYGEIVTCVFVSSALCANPDTVSLSRPMFVLPSIRPDITIRPIGSDSATYPGQIITLFSATTYGGTHPTYQWFKNRVAIPGATNSSYFRRNYDIDTFVVVMHSNEFCVVPAYDTSNAIVMKISKAGVDDVNSDKASFSLYPNPNKGSFVLNIPIEWRNMEWNCEIKDLLGRVIYRQYFEPDVMRQKSYNVDIPPAAFSGGVAAITLYNSRYRETRSFLITR